VSKNDFAKMNTFKMNDKKIDRLLAFGDIHLLVACPSAILLPLAGFVCACILMRYQKEYNAC